MTPDVANPPTNAGRPFMNAERQSQEAAARYAAILRERIEHKGYLRELAGYPNFVVWRYHTLNGQRKKPPVNPHTGELASPTDTTTWGSLDSALTALETGRISKIRGLGFMLSYSPFTGIDLDHCLADGVMQARAQEIITAMDSYTEYSPSFRPATGEGGIHLLFAGKPPSSKKVGNIEVYGEKHYLTITTNHLAGTPTTINSRQEALDALYRAIAPPIEERVYQNTRGVQAGVPLTELPEEAQRDEVLQRLLRGDITGYTSHSSADFVLVLKLLHWTGDNEALTRKLFLRSGLYREDKTERKTGATTYLDMTIRNALRKRRNPPMRW